MNNYEPVIGLEVHVELNTKSKMFCRCSADYFGKEPNTHTCPICLGLPGSLPYINKQAIEDCIKIGSALNCEVPEQSLFERKNYFYPDLPKGYQISQYRWPLAINGWIEVENDEGKTSKIRINRAHQEEDTGKLSHLGGVTNIDFNRSGVPLVEIVTEPDFTDSSQIRDYAKKLQLIFRYLGVSNADMEKGDMRLEANISVKRKGEKGLPPYRVELKNINSFRFMVAAVEYEIKRQIESLEKGERLIQETRGWDEDKKATYTQRVKEEANDYRYFPDPDLPKLAINKKDVERIRNSMPELPQEKIKRWVKNLNIKESDTSLLIESKQMADFFEKAIEYAKKHQISPQELANYIVNRKIDLIDTSIQQIVDDLVAKKSGVVDDQATLEEMVKEVIKENTDLVEKYKNGKVTVIQALIGKVMGKSKGKANAAKVKQILQNLLK
ncbi:Asp-tRNA(Asn)/Glu-tRNA(Gln) amidotransferase subunit GatB [Candidatus Daviesbacteria bacterium]|nr:Asp-tRNA(Asn)/Glu-tRNA(Gln) amidotransferase subunit GatB [Candidatus Daviesbacteria bacterium]